VSRPSGRLSNQVNRTLGGTSGSSFCVPRTQSPQFHQDEGRKDMTTANFRTTIVLMACITTSTLVGTAVAVPRGFVPGTICLGDDIGGTDNITRHTTGVYNGSAGASLIVYCPIPLTTDDGIALPADPTVRIRVSDGSSTGSISCSSVVINSSGDVIAASVPDSTGNAFQGDDELVNTMTAPASSVSSYVTTCTLPAISPNGSSVAYLRLE
jgi:hypothetical protein